VTADNVSVEQALAAYYDQEAETRAAKRLDDERVHAREQFIGSLAEPARTRLLEIGTGPGRDAASFVAHGIPTYGIDLSFAQAKLAAGEGSRQAVGSVRHLPIRDESFDVVWSMSVLMHVPNAHITVALAEIRRVLQPGGVAVIGVWGGPDEESAGARDHYQPPRLFSRRSDERWLELLSSVGAVEVFQIWDIRDENGWWYQYARIRRDARLSVLSE
jgi:SAM-dependent methyltransferase